MDKGRIISKALGLRESLNRSSKKNFDLFYDGLKIPRKVLELVQESTQDLDIIFHARRNYIVSLATAFEVFWREFIRVTVDSTGIGKSSIKNRKFTFNDLARVLGHKLTLGELVASTFTFHGIEPIAEIARDVFEFEFLRNLSKAEIKITTREGKDESSIEFSGEDILRNRDYIDQCFDLRNRIVHDIGLDIQISSDDIEKMELSMGKFCIFGAASWKECDIMQSTPSGKA